MNSEKKEDNATSKNIILISAGSSLVYPVLSAWCENYEKEKSIQINYLPIGSGAGFSELDAGTIDFAASDKPLSIDDLNNQKRLQFPLIVSGIVPVFNIEEIETNQLILNGELLSKIFMGIINKWDDPEIQKMNKSLKLPNEQIKIVRRADSSGTTYNFTHYLSDVSPEWKNKIGFSEKVKWPITTTAGKGNIGIVSKVNNTPYSISYLEYAYAIDNGLKTAALINNAGNIVTPNIKTFSTAADSADWKAENGFNLILTNAPGKNSWPIAASTWIILDKNEKPEVMKNIFNFFKWVYNNGGKRATELHYVPIPVKIADKIFNYWNLGK